jgi:hypothetical protein
MESYLSGVSAENSYGFLLKCDHLAGIKRVFYFAYGSNMPGQQIRERVFSPRKMLESVRHGFRFAYDKRSKKRWNVCESNQRWRR